MSSILSNLKQFNPSYENDDECPACPIRFVISHPADEIPK